MTERPKLRGPGEWTLRTKLVLWVAGSFIACAITLLMLQSAVLSGLLGTALGIDRGVSDVVAHVIEEGAAEDGEAIGAQISLTQVRTDVLSGLQWWSAAFLAFFGLVATLVAWTLSRRIASRIDELSAVASDVSFGRWDTRASAADGDADMSALAEKFNAMLDRLEAGFCRQELFAANASHELRTPLSTARLALEIPLNQGRVPLDLVPSVTASIRATSDSERIISSLLVLARSEALRAASGAETDRAAEGLDVADLVGEAVDQAAGLASDADISLRWVLHPARVEGHRGMLQLAMRNLMENAIHHNRRGGAVWVRVWQDEDCAHVAIDNDGPAYAADEVRVLTDPFHRGKRLRMSAPDSPTGHRGHGLGLSIVSSVIAAHRGRLRIEARLEGGLRIVCSIPQQLGR